MTTKPETTTPGQAAKIRFLEELGKIQSYGADFTEEKKDAVWEESAQAALKADPVRKAAIEAVKRVYFYYAIWNPEDNLPEDWPRDRHGDPMSPAEILEAVLDALPDEEAL